MTKENIQIDVLILGAGAAGLMCAIEAGKRNRKVTVIEHNSKIGQKIRISGGGRCNFTNMHTTPNNFLSQNAHFNKSALSRFTSENFCALVKEYKIPFHEKKLGQLFCDQSAQNIIDLLKKECQKYNVTILCETTVTTIQKKDSFLVSTNTVTLKTESLVIATGGLSIPSLGATDFGHKIAQQFDIKINPCRPGLVPLVLNEKDLNIFKSLAGVSLDALVSFEKISFRENILFTHKGLSGPAILQISSYWKPEQPIFINLIPEENMPLLLKENQLKKTSLKVFLKKHLPSRFINILCENFFETKNLNQYSSLELESIGKILNSFELYPKKTEGYAKAEVTVGGVDTNELSSKTMESKKIKRLYFIGEVVDVTGHLGGFNFQWAWASAHAAGQYA
jgi:predicted Rossmann fold flavoprotein